jgi:hypothetical protein
MASHTPNILEHEVISPHISHFCEKYECSGPICYAIMSMKSWADRSFTAYVVSQSLGIRAGLSSLRFYFSSFHDTVRRAIRR